MLIVHTAATVLTFRKLSKEGEQDITRFLYALKGVVSVSWRDSKLNRGPHAPDETMRTAVVALERRFVGLNHAVLSHALERYRLVDQRNFTDHDVPNRDFELQAEVLKTLERQHVTAYDSDRVWVADEQAREELRRLVKAWRADSNDISRLTMSW